MSLSERQKSLRPYLEVSAEGSDVGRSMGSVSEAKDARISFRHSSSSSEWLGELYFSCRNASWETISKVLERHVEFGSTVYTDDF